MALECCNGVDLLTDLESRLIGENGMLWLLDGVVQTSSVLVSLETLVTVFLGVIDVDDFNGFNCGFTTDVFVTSGCFFMGDGKKVFSPM
jgi:hypothetical protein